LTSDSREVTKADDEYWERTHPERPDRLTCIYEHLKVAGLLEGAVMVAGREAEGDEMSIVHKKEHCAHVCAIDCCRTIDDDTFANEHSAVAAKLAVGTTIDVVKAVMYGRAANGIALVRPPGHHAEADRAMGFCLFNNVACAARVAQKKMGAKRVLIFDWDGASAQPASAHFGGRISPARLAAAGRPPAVSRGLTTAVLY
jgi:histone deacetylase 6